MSDYKKMTDIELMSVREELEFYIVTSKKELNIVLNEINERVTKYKQNKEQTQNTKNEPT